MATERNLRVSDSDREAAAAQLREHYAQGRLTLDELNERLDRAFASRTNLELAAVTADLPYAPLRGVLPADRVGQGSQGAWARGNQHRAGQGWAGQGWAGPGGHGPGWDRTGWSGTGWGGTGCGGTGCGGPRAGGGQWGGGRSGLASLLGFIPLLCAFCCLIVLLGIMGFGLGSGPSLIVILLAVLAFLRRLFGFGRRRRGPVRRRRW